MAYYSVLAVTPTSNDWVAAYIRPANELVARHGGRYLARTASHERLEGEGEDAALRIIIEWPSKEAALAFMNDPAYAPHLAARTAGSKNGQGLPPAAKPPDAPISTATSFMSSKDQRVSGAALRKISCRKTPRWKGP